jgi:predicted nucleotidyltransferase
LLVVEWQFSIMVDFRTEHKVAAKLLKGMQADEVWLFGSRARGDAEQGSDLDLLVVVPDSEEARHVRSRRARLLVADVPESMDVAVVTRDEWQRQAGVVNTLPYVASHEGRLLAKRDG